MMMAYVDDIFAKYDTIMYVTGELGYCDSFVIIMMIQCIFRVFSDMKWIDKIISICWYLNYLKDS